MKTLDFYHNYYSNWARIHITKSERLISNIQRRLAEAIGPTAILSYSELKFSKDGANYRISFSAVDDQIQITLFNDLNCVTFYDQTYRGVLYSGPNEDWSEDDINLLLSKIAYLVVRSAYPNNLSELNEDTKLFI